MFSSQKPLHALSLMSSTENAKKHLELFSDMSMDDVRNYEKNMHEQTNIKVWFDQPSTNTSSTNEIQSDGNTSVCYTFPEVHLKTNLLFFGK